MILSQGILDELRHQAELQGKNNYRCIEVDWRTVIALCDEIEEFRNGTGIGPVIRSGIPKEGNCIGVAHIKTADNGKFIRDERVVFAGKEYNFGYYIPHQDGWCVIFETGSSATKDALSVPAHQVKEALFLMKKENITDEKVY